MLYFLFFLLAVTLGMPWAVRDYVPRGWSRLGRTDADTPMKLQIYLKHQNLEAFSERVDNLVDPTSPTWGKWLSIDEIVSSIAPTNEAREHVAEWVRKAGLAIERDDVDTLHVSGTARDVEQLLRVEVHDYKRGKKTVARQWGKSHVPHKVAKLLDFVGGVDEFPAAPRPKRTGTPKRVGDVDPGLVTPQLLRQIYGVPSSVAVNANSSLCLAEFQNDQSFSPTDLTQFQTAMGLTSAAVAQNHIVGPYDDSQPDLEATLDVQWGMALGSNAQQSVELWYWTEPGWMLTFAQTFFSTPVVPYVVSMSWGWPSDENCQIVNCANSQQYVTRANTEFMKIVARGVSLFAASGDQGAPGDENYQCYNSQDPLSDIYPGGSPYITSVGATMLVSSTKSAPKPGHLSRKRAAAQPPFCSTNTCATSTDEVTCSYPDALITSGGGFTDYFAMPSWQKSAVSAYIASPSADLPPKAYYKSGNRAFPDVSACGHNFPILAGGSWETVDGTSASTPVTAALIALINSARFNAGKGPIGFWAPVAYALFAKDPTSFIDITVGDNKSTESCTADYGYTAIAGFDAATGLGTPVFTKCLSYAMSLP
jgi:subtilase family serine protease